MTLSGKVALVTGASRGIGKAIAIALAARGMKVAVAARGREGLDATVAAARAVGAAAEGFAGDVGDPAFCAALARQAAERLGPIDVLVNNAGVGVFRPLCETTDEELEAPLRVPVLAALALAKACLPSMLARRDGAIVNLTSIGGKIAIPRAAAYTAARFGIAGMTASLREETRGTGVRVILICPGEVATDYFRENRSSTDDLPKSRKLFRVLSADDVARATVGALETRRDEVVMPSALAAFARLALAWPSLGRTLMRMFE